MTKPGKVRFDEEGNNKVWEDDDVTDYWINHYANLGCVLCENTGIITVRSGRHFCICPNGQSMRWHLKVVPEER